MKMFLIFLLVMLPVLEIQAYEETIPVSRYSRPTSRSTVSETFQGRSAPLRSRSSVAETYQNIPGPLYPTVY